jgi:hypothetical protein
VSHLRDSASWIWPGGMCWHRSLAEPAMKASELQQSVPKATAHDAVVTSQLSEKRRKTARRQRWTK